MAFVKKRKTGYYAVAEYRDNMNQRHQKGAGTFKLKREALEAAQKLEKKLNGVDVDLTKLSLAQYFQRWYELFKKPGITKATQNRYNIIRRVIADYFGVKKIAEIRRSDYQAFINWYGANHARDSVVKLNGAMRACVGAAIDDDLITKDFTHNVQLVHDKSRQLRVEYLNTDELLKLKQATAKGLNPRYSARYMILTAILTGMRKSEIQALTWRDIDFLHATISVNKSWNEKEKAFKPTKTRASNRTIKVNRELLNWLADLKANRTTQVFMNRLGTVPTSNALNKCLRSIMADCGISKQGFHFHSLRHVHVAYLLGQGVDVYAISKRLGHSDITITLSTYSYLIEEYKAKNDSLIIDKLSALLWRPAKVRTKCGQFEPECRYINITRAKKYAHRRHILFWMSLLGRAARV